MKKIEIFALAVSAALVATGIVVVGPSIAGTPETDVRNFAQPSIQPLSTSTVTRDDANSGRYKTAVSVDVVPGVLDIEVQYVVRKKSNSESNGDIFFSSPSISLRNKLTPASVLVDFQGNIIHGDFTEIADFGYGAPQTFSVSDVINNLECKTEYQVKFVARQVLSGISNTVQRSPDVSSEVIRNSFGEPDFDLDGIPNEYDADSLENIDEWANSYDEENGWYDPASFNSDWTDLPMTGDCPSIGGGGGGAPAPAQTPPPAPVPAPSEPAIDTVKASVYFGGDSSVLSKDSYARIASLYSKIPKGATNIKIIFKGFVSPTVVTNYDKKLAAARVKNVKAQLMKRGMDAEISIPTLAVDKKSAASKARRVDIIVTYDLPNN